MSEQLELTGADWREIERMRCEASFAYFVKRAWKQLDSEPLKTNWHIDALCDHLSAVVRPVPLYEKDGTPRIDIDTGEQVEGCIRRLCINVPPGSAKSTIVSILFPIWVWTWKPKHKFMSTSHNIELSTDHALASRRVLESDWYQRLWPIQLRDDQNQKTNYVNEAGGRRSAKPFSTLTGSRANTVLIDDPHTTESAQSSADRISTLRQFRFSVPTRINDPQKDSIIVIMQRLHTEDVSGFILETPELGYEHLCIPMEYEGNEDYTSIGWQDPRAPGGAHEGETLMFPAHFPQSFLDETLASTTPDEYAGQFQQRPVPKEGGSLKAEWFEPYRFVPGNGPADYPPMNYYMTSDHGPAGTRDFNVFRMWGIDADRNVWLVDSFRDQCSLDKALGIERIDGRYKVTAQGALAMIRKWKPKKFFPERDHSWLVAANMFRSALKETQTHVLIEPQPTSGEGNKADKADAYAALAQLGQVKLPKGKVGDIALQEYMTFPGGKNDDQVDADAMIGRVINQMRAPRQRADEVRTTMPKGWDYKASKRKNGDNSDRFWG